MKLTHATWYFDFISPFAYLQWRELQNRPLELELRPRAILLAGLLKHYGHKGPAEIPAKRIQIYRHCQWLADRAGIPFRMPPAHPFHPLPLLRLAVACEYSVSAIDTVFHCIWGEGNDPNEIAVWRDLCATCGLADVEQRIADVHIKNCLRTNTDAAIQRGVYGVPTLAIGDQLFWGYDCTDFARAYIADPDMFSYGEMYRIGNLPAAVQRSV